MENCVHLIQNEGKGAMGKYAVDAKKLLDLVGGKENISAVSHCMTRMRFVLVDPDEANVEAIEDLPSVKGTFTQAGQFQIIIGNDVASFYDDFTEVSGIEGVSKSEAKEAAGANQNWLQRALGVLGEIFAPIIPALICGGLILGFRNIIGDINFFDAAGNFDVANGTQSLADLSQFWAGTYSFLWLIGEAVFHMLPVGICWSVTKKMGTTEILGIILGLTMVSSQLLNGFLVPTTPADQIPVWNFGFAQVRMIGYQGQVIAALMGAFVLVELEKFFKKVTPEVVSMIVVPFCSLVPAVIITHAFVGPIGWAIGTAVADAVNWGLSSDFRLLFAAGFGFIYAPLVMTGLHHMTNAIDTQMVAALGYTTLWPMIALSNIAQGSAVLGMSVLQKHNERAQQVNIPACISCYLGVTEPALFGVNVKYKFPLLCGMIGSACAAMICTGNGVQALSIGVGGLPGILSIRFQYWGIFALSMLVAVVIPFLLTLAAGKKSLTERDLYDKKPALEAEATTAEAAPAEETVPAATETVASETVPEAATDEAGIVHALIAPIGGTVHPISDMADPVFASKTMGDGVMIEPAPAVSRVVAPADATVSAIMPGTYHAIGLTLDNGIEVLIHVGIDTVDMNGDGFTCPVKQEQHVKAGDLLLTFDQAKIKAAGHSVQTAVILTEPDDAKDIAYFLGAHALAGETEIVTYLVH